MRLADDGASFRISSEALPERERAEAMRDWIGPKLLRVELEPVGDGPFQLDLSIRLLPQLALASASDFDLRSRRTRELVADSDDDVHLGINLAGTYIAEQRARQVVLRGGEAVVTSCADAGELIHPRHGRALGLKIPRAVLAPLVGNVDDVVMRVIANSNPALRMLTGYLGLLWREDALSSQELLRTAVAHVHDLVALAIGATRDGAEIARGRGLRAARLRGIKSHIAEHLSDLDLRPAAVAASQGISESYLRKLFESEGTSFTEFVLAQRLGRVHRLLTAHNLANRTIAALALSVGFGDISYFNKVFRHRYDATPSEVRERALQERQ